MSQQDLYILRDQKIFIPATSWYEEREIAEVKENNATHIIEFLQEKFNELLKEVNDLLIEFQQTDDKVKLAGKVNRKKGHFAQAKAIGNFSLLLKPLEEMEVIIKAAIEENIAKKEKICVDTAQLLETNEWKLATEQLRNLQKEYKDLPAVPDPRNDELKDKFENLRDVFFKKKQESFEHFEQELLDNLSKKIDLCEKAEQLQNSTDWKKTTEELQKLNEEWKTIGIVPKHRMEELWFRFNTAKDIFFNKKREHFNEIKGEQEENLQKKLAIIEQATLLKDSNDWKGTTEAFNKLMEDWKKTGRATHEKNEEVWEQFISIKNEFYARKDAHFGKIKMQLEDNFARKHAIVQHAESLQNTNDFEMGTVEFMTMIEEWKGIGRVAKEHGDELWERFIKAKKNFFDRKDAHRDLKKKEIAKDIEERLSRNKSFYNKIMRDMQREEDLLFDVEDRLKNLPPTLRSYEKREQYIEMLDDIKKKVNSMKSKVQEVKEKIYADEREINFLKRGPKKKNTVDNKIEQSKKINKSDNAKATTEENPREITIENTTKYNEEITTNTEILDSKTETITSEKVIENNTETTSNTDNEENISEEISKAKNEDTNTGEHVGEENN